LHERGAIVRRRRTRVKHSILQGGGETLAQKQAGAMNAGLHICEA
jgi:hypothetical protein